MRQDAPHYFRVCVCVTEPAVPLLALNLECKHYFRLHAEVSHPAQTLSPIYHRKVSSRVSKGRKAKKLKKHWLFYGSTPALQIAQAYPANIRVKTTVQYGTAQVTFNGTSTLFVRHTNTLSNSWIQRRFVSFCQCQPTFGHIISPPPIPATSTSPSFNRFPRDL